MSTSSELTMAREKFLTWAEAQEGRFELHDGVVKKITPERVDHVLTKGEAYRVLAEAVKQAGCDCEVFGSGGGVQIDDRTIYAPDGVIVCGPKLPDDAILLTNLVVVVEVLSPSTAAIDHGRNLSGYFSLPSVHHYLISIPSAASPSITSAGKARRSRQGCSAAATRVWIRPASTSRSRRSFLRLEIAPRKFPLAPLAGEGWGEGARPLASGFSSGPSSCPSPRERGEGAKIATV